MAPIIHWFRRDLRLHDNTALAAAAQESSGDVIPLFILDPHLLNPEGRFTSPARVRFLLEALHDLDASLRDQGSALLLRSGDPRDELPRLVRKSGAVAVWCNRDYSPYATRRDEDIRQALDALGCPFRQAKDAVLWELDEIVTKGGTPYTVYTPYARQWRQRTAEQPPTLQEAPRLRRPAASMPPGEPIPTLDSLGLQTAQQAIPGGERPARQILAAFTDLRHTHTIAGYDTDRDRLALPATSRLSAHLHLGTISPRACLQAAHEVEQRHPDTAEGVRAWVGELAWRDFYIQILAHFPHVLRGAFRQQYDALEWDNNPQLFDAWCAGRTGYPIVDAAMRQLNHEAWMHNRARMIVASFLTKDLLIDWRWGERYFMQQLVDGDPAANNGGWQWAAGTGTDAQPYFRIFNPTSQGHKFDPTGDYVRQHVPELTNVPDRFIHEPWKMSAAQQQQAGVQPGRDYPQPIVEHKEMRQRALALYKAVRQEGD